MRGEDCDEQGFTSKAIAFILSRCAMDQSD